MEELKKMKTQRFHDVRISCPFEDAFVKYVDLNCENIIKEDTKHVE